MHLIALASIIFFTTLTVLGQKNKWVSALSEQLCNSIASELLENAAICPENVEGIDIKVNKYKYAQTSNQYKLDADTLEHGGEITRTYYVGVEYVDVGANGLGLGFRFKTSDVHLTWKGVGRAQQLIKAELAGEIKEFADRKTYDGMFKGRVQSGTARRRGGGDSRGKKGLSRKNSGSSGSSRPI